MLSIATTGRRALAALLCVALLVWSVLPATSHAPAIFETLQQHAEMIVEHGHSHGLEEDLAWAMHGHGHDSSDHDHSPVILAAVRPGETFTSYGTLRRPVMTTSGPWPVHLIDRPPPA
jgi:hypothetical protein